MRSLRDAGDLAATAALALLAIPLVVLDAWSPLRFAIGALLVLVLPGYALASAIFPGRSTGGLARAALSVGLSLASVPLAVLLLGLTPLGIRAGPVVVVLALLTAGASAVAFRRRALLPAGERAAALPALPDVRWSRLGPVDRWLAVGMAASVLVAGGAVAWTLSTPRPDATFTEFYVLGPGGRAEDYPTNSTGNETRSVLLGVVNREGRAVTYRLVATLGPAEGPKATLEDGPLTLADGGREERVFAFTTPAERGTYRLGWDLHRDGEAAPYRSLHLWIRVAGGT